MIMNEQKSQIALLKVALRLTELGYATYATIGELKHPTDLVGIKNKVCHKFQIKYMDRENTAVINVPRGNDGKKYEPGDFDFYALYVPTLDVVLFPAFEFMMKNIRLEFSKGVNTFFWYEDFLEPTMEAKKRSPKEFNLPRPKHLDERTGGARPETYKVERPSKETLNELIWSMPTTEVAKKFNMSDNGISRWISDYGLTKPPRGYWQRKNAGKN